MKLNRDRHAPLTTVSSRWEFPALLAGLTLCSSTFAAFQPTRPLGQIGATELQQRTGDAVQTTCIGFIMNPVDAASPNAAEQRDLFDKCGEMVNTANRLNGAEAGTDKDLGISATQLQEALQNVAGEEIAAAGSLATEVSADQAGNVTSRIAELVGGSSTLQLSSVNRYGTDGLYALDSAALGTDTFHATAVSGGGASDDEAIAGGLGAYVNGILGTAYKQSTDNEDGFDADLAGFTAGVDYRFPRGTVVGAAFGFTNSRADFDETDRVVGGDLELQSISGSLYALQLAEGYFLDGLLSFGAGSIDLRRRILIPSAAGAEDTRPDVGGPNDGANRLATADTDTTQFGASVGAGMEVVNGPFTLAPYARLSFATVEIDAYDESGADGLDLSVQSQDIDSIKTAFGFRLMAVQSVPFGVIAPQLSVELVHEYADNDREIVSTYLHDPRDNQLVVVTDDPDRDHLVIGMGLSTVLKGGLQLYGDVKSLVGQSDVDESVYTLGARLEF